jgi:chorismate synthase
VLDGVPAGVPLSEEDLHEDLQRRKPGAKGTTPRQETDEPRFLAGLFNGYTTGSPLVVVFENANTRSADYEKQREHPRPGHADFVAHHKFEGFEDYRGGGHFSGRLTVCLVAAGSIAKKILSVCVPSLQVKAEILEIAGLKDPQAGLQKGIDEKDSVGGIVECVVKGIPAGWGEPFFDSAESLLSHIVFSIPAIRGIEFGTGFAAARMFGSEHNDAIINQDGKTVTNHAGGIIGGITNGNPLVFRVAVKPTASTPKEQNSLNWTSGEVEPFSVKGRHDLCIALRVPVVLEAATAMVMLDLWMRSKASRKQ